MPKISELNAITSVANTDLLMVVHDPGGSPSTNKITVNNFVTSVSTQLRGYTGSVGSDGGYTGSAGTSGYTGSSGTSGYTGSAGSIGTSGYTGSTGSIGTSGYTGSTGSNGYTGSAGTSGYTGSTGASGYTGSTGSDGVDAFTVVNSSNTYTATANDTIIYCDPNSISQDITVILPITGGGLTGKRYSVKNTNNAGGGLKVRVTTDNPGSNYIENPITGQASLYYDITLTNDQQDWVFDGSVYRHSGSLTSAPIFLATQDTYHQVVLQNISNANNASGDWVAYNNEGNYEQGLGPFIDMGINSNTYTDTTYGNVWGPNDGYLYNYGGNLIIGPQTDHSIKLLAGNTNADNVRLTVNSTAVYVNATMTLINSAPGASPEVSSIYSDTNILLAVNNYSWKLDTNGNFNLPSGTKIKDNNSTVIPGTSHQYASGGANAVVWTASSNSVIAAKVTVRVQSDMNARTELFTMLVAKDSSYVNSNIIEQITSNGGYGASIITAGLDANNCLVVAHKDPNGFGNGYKVKYEEFLNTW